ncbi:universal stress protein [Natronorubrum texcoconense]|uniref:Nucleotide-binding universal stress protein, UspA family n=1 Tax=Natronorubrum texcoconense TaxID=1095776 RepID=A0A1G8XM24_9EURY|nr:universal stress protein [Natronorubrum texcoconense]SDJ90820.1 Nucleotide-binding universal stress protein, UspA family [Natronorubrum texcoconense]
MYDTILVATDGSQSANRAVDHALDLASTFDATLHAIYVVDTRRYGESMLSGSDGVVTEVEDRGRELLEEIEMRADVDVTLTDREGRPYEQIGEYAEEIDADLLVLGNRGLGSSGEIGSNAERVVRYVDRPVITA